MSTTVGGEFVKVYHLNELTEDKRLKLDEFINKFKLKTQTTPQFIVCSPGRVNLIGDHVDYHGFSVLPMAIENSIWLGCSFSDNKPTESQGDLQQIGTINLMNVDDDAFPGWTGTHSLVYGSQLNISHRWQNYILCGYHGILANKMLKIEPNEILIHASNVSSNQKLLQETDEQVKNLKDFHILVDSDLQPASGLSSSSALVCASAVATSLLLKNSYQKDLDLINSHELAASCPRFEHLIGTHGGGMDQAVIMTAQEGYAKYVEFVPKLTCENVLLPNGTVWFVSHCGVDYPKAATSGFNTRVLETKLGAAFIAKAMQSSEIELDSSITLAKVKNVLFKGFTTTDIIEYIRNDIFKGTNAFDVGQICDKLGFTRTELITRFNTTNEFIQDTSNDKLQLLNRCEHVLEEAERVEQFRSICVTSSDSYKLGQLMTQSHNSLRDKYECSHPALDKLVGVALDAGALGSRLTGAGWGGCIVTLVEESKSDSVYERLREVSKFTFRTEPKGGCHIIKID